MAGDSIANTLFIISNASFVAAAVCGIVAIILFFGGLQTLFLGLIGEYIGKNYLDQNGTPQFTVKNTYGINDKEQQK